MLVTSLILRRIHESGKKKKITDLIEGLILLLLPPPPQLLSQADKTFKKGFLQKHTRN